MLRGTLWGSLRRSMDTATTAAEAGLLHAARPHVAPERTRALLAAALTALGLVVYDVLGVLARAPAQPALGLSVYALASVGLAALCLSVTGLARAELRVRSAGLPAAFLLHGALDGLGVWLIAIELGRPETIRGGDRYLALAALLVGGAALGAFSARTRRLAWLGSAALIALALAADAYLPYREYAWTRLCLGSIIAAAVARLLTALPAARVRRASWLLSLGCAGCFVLADPLLRASPDARAVLQSFGAQGTAYARILWILSDLDGDQAPSGFGAWDCAPLDPEVFPAAHE